MYHEQLTQLQNVFGDVPFISRAAAARYLRTDVRTLAKTKGFPLKKVGKQYRVPLVGLARWLS